MTVRANPQPFFPLFTPLRLLRYYHTSILLNLRTPPNILQVEKKYLRLTSAPDSRTVRPEPVLKQVSSSISVLLYCHTAILLCYCTILLYYYSTRCSSRSRATLLDYYTVILLCYTTDDLIRSTARPFAPSSAPCPHSVRTLFNHQARPNST